MKRGLKKYDSKDKERWDLIAKLVGSKNKKQCIRRFKFIVQQLKNKK